MILTVTLNPSVDISYELNELKVDTSNRTENVNKTAGGKGLNVARVLRQLEEEVAATGFLGGSLGGFIRGAITEVGIKDHFVGISGETRNCIAIIHEGLQTEILEGGPEITQDEKNAFKDEFKSIVGAYDYITISGSQPKGLAADFYGDLLEIAQEKGKRVLLDTSGEALKAATRGDVKPFLIKPNLEEFAGLLDVENPEELALEEALQNPILEGIPWIVLTLGADGAMIKHENDIYHAEIPKVEAVNPVGSGDSVIAGFASGLSQKLVGEDLIKFGLSLGILNAMEEQTGMINPKKIDWCTEQIKVSKLN